MNILQKSIFIFFIVVLPTITNIYAGTNEVSQHHTSNILPKTNWGFHPFTIPKLTIIVKPGENIQDAIDKLPNGGTLKLTAGIFDAHRVNLKSNIIFEGAGDEKTIINFKGKPDTYLIGVTGDMTKNIIIRNLTLNATGNGVANGLEITYGVSNILIENIEIFGAGRSNIMVWSPDWKRSCQYITFENINSHHAQLHGFTLGFVKGIVIANCKAFNNVSGDGWNLSEVLYGEIVNNQSYNNASGIEYFGASYIYMHDNYINNSSKVGIRFSRLIEDKLYLDMENNVIMNSSSGVVDWGDTYPTPTFAELVLKGNKLSKNTSNYIRIRGADKIYEYDDDIGVTKARAGIVNPIQRPNGSTPANDNIGYTSWPMFSK